MDLLTIGNPKTLKGQKRGYLTAVMHLAPFDLSGRNVCPMATPGCAAACLNTAGRGGIGLTTVGDNTIQAARRRRTDWYFDDRPGFMDTLRREIAAHVKRAGKLNLVPCVRLNGTSDLRFEKVKVGDADNIMQAFPDLQFYDYTKLPNRRDLPANYHLTYSLAETPLSWRHSLAMLERGISVAVVLSGCGDSVHPKPFPATWQGRPLVDGDESDLRFLDPAGVYIGLRAKGRAKSDNTGFVRPANLPTVGKGLPLSLAS